VKRNDLLWAESVSWIRDTSNAYVMFVGTRPYFFMEWCIIKHRWQAKYPIFVRYVAAFISVASQYVVAEILRKVQHSDIVFNVNSVLVIVYLGRNIKNFHILGILTPLNNLPHIFV
jgi:hypothetical protein